MWIKTQWGRLVNADKFASIGVCYKDDGNFYVCGERTDGIENLGEYQTQSKAESAKAYIFSCMEIKEHAVEMP